jgi:hypothetical protein
MPIRINHTKLQTGQQTKCAKQVSNPMDKYGEQSHRKNTVSNFIESRTRHTWTKAYRLKHYDDITAVILII